MSKVLGTVRLGESLIDLSAIELLTKSGDHGGNQFTHILSLRNGQRMFVTQDFAEQVLAAYDAASEQYMGPSQQQLFDELLDAARGVCDAYGFASEALNSTRAILCQAVKRIDEATKEVDDA